MNWEETRGVLAKLGVENLPENFQYRVNLIGANLCGADLYCANLYGADLRDAYLRDANLRRANLRRANLCGADLRRANLSCADLHGANLRDVDLRDVDLSGANLRGADLSGANLRRADLRRADLSGANLPTYNKWRVSWGGDGVVKIGCELKTLAEWDEWFAGDETFETERNTADFERIEAEYQHAKRMHEIYQKYEASNEARAI